MNIDIPNYIKDDIAKNTRNNSVVLIITYSEYLVYHTQILTYLKKLAYKKYGFHENYDGIFVSYFAVNVNYDESNDIKKLKIPYFS